MLSRFLSFVEAVTNIVVGYGLAALTQIIVFPMFGLNASLSDKLLPGSAVAIVSFALGFALRRIFDTLDGRR